MTLNLCDDAEIDDINYVNLSHNARLSLMSVLRPSHSLCGFVCDEPGGK